MNGKPGDHPYTDITVYHRRVYSELADALVRQIDGLADERTRRELADLLLFRHNENNQPDIAGLERELAELRDRLRASAIERGWEVDA